MVDTSIISECYKGKVMYEILLAVDENKDRARAQVDTIVDLPGSSDHVRVQLLHVFENNPEGGSIQRVASVRETSKHLDEAGIEHELLSSSGDPAEIIVQEADDLGVDLICVGGRQRSPAGKALFGSVAQRVILNAQHPVLTTKVPRDRQ